MKPHIHGGGDLADPFHDPASKPHSTHFAEQVRATAEPGSPVDLLVQGYLGLVEQLEAAQSRLNSDVFMGKPVDYWLGLQEQLETLRAEREEMAMVLDGQGWKRIRPGQWERQELSVSSPASRPESAGLKLGDIVTINEDGPVYYEPGMDE